MTHSSISLGSVDKLYTGQLKMIIFSKLSIYFFLPFVTTLDMATMANKETLFSQQSCWAGIGTC